MAKNSNRKGGWDGDIHDEIDEFGQEQEQILLDQAGGRSKLQGEEYDLSDEEVMALSEEDSDENEDLNDEQLYGKISSKDEEEKQGWGSSKGNYYGADEVQDEEEAIREQQEALRIQKEQLKKLKTDDYFEEDDLEEWKRSAKEADRELEGVSEELPGQDPSLLDSVERLDFLKMSHPEVLGLISELEKYRPLVEVLKKDSSQVGSVKFAALSAYIGAIGVYFALFVGKTHENRQKLKDHAIMEGILKAKEVWRVAEQLNAAEENSEDLSQNEEDTDLHDFKANAEHISEDFFSEADEEVDYKEAQSFNEQISSKRKRTEASDSESEDEFAIGVPTNAKRLLKNKRPFDNDDFKDGEIDEADLEDKKAKKRTLRFYTSKIDQQAQRVAEKYSGDADLPYRETRFEQRKRLVEEARLRGINGNGNSAVDDFGSDDEAPNGGKTVTEEFEEDYYNMVKSASKQKKEDRREAHGLALQAAREGKVAELQEEDLGEDGKRAINYQILKNKGLTSKRKKDDRNSRVKKRKRYEKALKKLPSVRQVYKAPASAYGGETTGIKKNISRGVKFQN
jgi:U3 small nucleolar RNA-associated protein 3